MEYLLDQKQSEYAAQVLGEGVTSQVLEEEIENLRAIYYRIQFGEISNDVDLDGLSRRAYLLATLVSGPCISYEPHIVGKAFSVAAVIFEYLSEVTTSGLTILNCWIKSFQVDSRIMGSKPPLHFSLVSIAFGFPSPDFSF